MRYRRDIDGLRAIAVVPVILFHAGFAAFRGGFVGVDVFFVISGYLITGIILDGLAEGSFSLARFYERRIRRILPALFLVVWATLPAAWLLLPAPMMAEFAISVASVPVFLSNVLFWWQADYFDTDLSLKPLIHTWTLAVEEHFYLVIPLFLMGTRRWSARRLALLIGALLLVSLVLAEALVRSYPAATFYFLHTRAWELLIGSLAALRMRQGGIPLHPGAAAGLSLAGLALIAASVFLLDRNTPFPGLAALPATLGTALLLLFGGQGHAVNRVLSHPLPVGIGLISYSAYLWHQPLFAFARHASREEPPAWAMAALSMAALALAYASWRWVEVPFRDRRRTSARAVLMVTALAGAGLVAIGWQVYRADGEIGQPARDRYAVRFLAFEHDNRKLQHESWHLLRARSGKPKYGVTLDPFERRAWFDPADPRPRLLVVGNSISKDLYNALVSSRRAAAAYQIARYGTQLADIDERLFAAPNYRQADVVLFSTRYDRADLDRLDAILSRLARDGKRAVFVRNLPDLGVPAAGRAPSDKLVIDQYLAGNRSGAAVARLGDRALAEQVAAAAAAPAQRRMERRIAALKRRHPALVVLDRAAYSCDPEPRRCFSMDAGLRKYYYDAFHTTLAGARFFGSRIDAADWLAPLR